MFLYFLVVDCVSRSQLVYKRNLHHEYSLTDIRRRGVTLREMNCVCESGSQGSRHTTTIKLPSFCQKLTLDMKVNKVYLLFSLRQEREHRGT